LIRPIGCVREARCGKLDARHACADDRDLQLFRTQRPRLRMCAAANQPTRPRTKSKVTNRSKSYFRTIRGGLIAHFRLVEDDGGLFAEYDARADRLLLAVGAGVSRSGCGDRIEPVTFGL
jgi:hypothetical protein